MKDARRLCDGTQDCDDGADEAPETCAQTNSSLAVQTVGQYKAKRL
jgi:hypothetical protein